MALVAMADGQKLDLSVMDDDSWDYLRSTEQELICLGCQGLMHTRECAEAPDKVSGAPRVVRLFSHNPGHAQRCKELGLGESPEHAKLKTEVAHSVRRAGWEAEVEVWHDEDCRSDVVATSPDGKQRRAFEAQLSPLKEPVALARHEKYRKAVGDCTWLHTGRRHWTNRVPSLEVDEQNHFEVVGGIYVSLRMDLLADPMPVSAAVEGVLTERLHYFYSQGDDEDGWGTYIARSSASGATRRRAKHRRARNRPQAAARFCDRLQDLERYERYIDELGLGPIEVFQSLRVAALQRFRHGGPTAWTDEDRHVLAVAGSLAGLGALQLGKASPRML